jgi:hypothetical protein
MHAKTRQTLLSISCRLIGQHLSAEKCNDNADHPPTITRFNREYSPPSAYYDAMPI